MSFEATGRELVITVNESVLEIYFGRNVSVEPESIKMVSLGLMNLEAILQMYSLDILCCFSACFIHDD